VTNAAPEPPGFSDAEQPAVRNTPMTPISNTGTGKSASRRIDMTETTGEDDDAIPAVDSNYRK